MMKETFEKSTDNDESPDDGIGDDAFDDNDDDNDENGNDDVKVTCRAFQPCTSTLLLSLCWWDTGMINTKSQWKIQTSSCWATN